MKPEPAHDAQQNRPFADANGPPGLARSLGPPHSVPVAVQVGILERHHDLVGHREQTDDTLAGELAQFGFDPFRTDHPPVGPALHIALVGQRTESNTVDAVGRLPGGIRWAAFWCASTPQMTRASKSLPVKRRPERSR